MTVLQPSGKVWPGDIREMGHAVQLSLWYHHHYPRRSHDLQQCDSLSTPLARQLLGCPTTLWNSLSWTFHVDEVTHSETFPTGCFTTGLCEPHAFKFLSMKWYGFGSWQSNSP